MVKLYQIFLKWLLPILGFFLASIYLHAQTTLKSSNLSNGAATVQGPTYKLRATVGQTLVGSATSGSYKLLVGFNTGNTVVQPDLQLTVAQINPASVERGKETTATFTLKNAGEAAAVGNLIVKAYLSLNTELDVSDTELASFVVSNGLAANAVINYPGTGQSNKILIPVTTPLAAYQIILSADPGNIIEETNETNNLKTLALEVKLPAGTADDTSPPTFTNVSTSAKFTSGAKITFTANDNIGVTKVLLFHRGILAPKFLDSLIVTSTSGNYAVTVDEKWLDEMGMEYYLKGYDAANNRGESNPHSFIYKSLETASSPLIPTLGVGGNPEDYAMFSIPYLLEDSDIRTIFSGFGDYDKKKWRLLHYENGKNTNYTEPFTKIERGKGYWFNGKETVEVRTGEGATPPNNQTSPFQLSLAKGWNQIGNPYPFNIDWSDVVSVSANAAAKDKVDGYTVVYDQGSFKETDVLKTWGGAFVHTDEALTLSFPVTLKNTASGRVTNTNEFARKTIDEDIWAVQLSIQQGTFENSFGGFGMHPLASESKDRFDKLTVPRFIHYLELNSYHDEYFDPWFSRDVVPTADHYAWSFTIESDNDESDIVLGWDNLLLGTNDAVLLLYDPQDQVLLNMKQVNTYRMTKTNKRTLKILFGREEKSLKTDMTGLGQIYPNPVVEGATVPFITKNNNQFVEISVFDLMGKRVSGVVNRYYNEGYHQEKWEALDILGNRLPTGIYFYRMNVNGRFVGQPNRLIVR